MRFFQLSLTSGRKLDAVLYVLRNRKLEMLVVETLPKRFRWARFDWQRDF